MGSGKLQFPFFILSPTLIVGALVLLFFLYQDDQLLLDSSMDTGPILEQTKPETEEPYPGADNEFYIGKPPPPIFGNPPAAEELETEKVEQLPETRLELKLKGTFTNSDPDKSSAVLSAPSGKTKLIFVGQRITADSMLVKVDRELVVLRRNGKDEILRLPIYESPLLQPDEFFVSGGPSTGAAKYSNSSTTKPEDIKPEDRQVAKAITPSGTLPTATNRSRRQSLQERMAALRKRQTN